MLERPTSQYTLTSQHFKEILPGLSVKLRRYAMCGMYDGNGEKVNYSILSTACLNASNRCYSTGCMRDYIVDAFNDRLYKFCPHGMNLLVTRESWSSWAYGLEYTKPDSETYCVAYCTP